MTGLFTSNPGGFKLDRTGFVRRDDDGFTRETRGEGTGLFLDSMAILPEDELVSSGCKPSSKSSSGKELFRRVVTLLPPPPPPPPTPPTQKRDSGATELCCRDSVEILALLME